MNKSNRSQYGKSTDRYATDEEYAREAQRMAMEMMNNPQIVQQMEAEKKQQQIKRANESITYNRMYGESLEDPLPGKDYKGDSGWFGILFASVIMIAFGVLAIYMGMRQINLQGGEVDIFVILSVLLNGTFIPIVIGILLIVAAIAIIVINAVSKEPTPEEIAARQPTLTMADKVAMDQMSELEKLQYLHDKSREAYERNTRNGNYR